MAIAQEVLLLSLVIATGLLFGSVRFFGIQLGIAGVLFSGLFFSYLGASIQPEVLEFIRELGLIFFVYTVGIQLGPGFFNSFKRDGIKLNALAAAIVLLGAVSCVAIIHFLGVEKSIGVGLFSGSTTNTPSLAAAQEALKSLNTENAADQAKNAGIGYAVAYPFGIVGIILSILFIKALFRINVEKESASLLQSQATEKTPPEVANFVVKNPNLENVPIEKLSFDKKTSVVVSRIFHNGTVNAAQPDTRIHTGDVLLAVGPQQELESFRILVGEVSDMDIRKLPQTVTAQRIVVTKKQILGKTVQELAFFERYGVSVTRLIRSEIQLPVSASTKLQYGDVLMAVGEEQMISKAAKEIGNSPSELNHPHLVPIFLGIFLGVSLGIIPFLIPGMPAPVKLGIAGGPLVVAIILSRIGHFGPFVWHLPTSANFILREVGIALFLACVGLKSGSNFVLYLVNGSGLNWILLSSIITLVPLLIVGLFARLVWKLNFLTICGLLSGSMTDPPALAFANKLTHSQASSISYATVYPLTMLLRILLAQIIVLFF